MPHSLIAVKTTISFLLVVIIAFNLGQMSVAFSGSQWAWMALVAFIVALIAGGISVIHAIWSASPPEALNR